jgi:hypothetical protein
MNSDISKYPQIDEVAAYINQVVRFLISRHKKVYTEWVAFTIGSTEDEMDWFWKVFASGVSPEFASERFHEDFGNKYQGEVKHPRAKAHDKVVQEVNEIKAVSVDDSEQVISPDFSRDFSNLSDAIDYMNGYNDDSLAIFAEKNDSGRVHLATIKRGSTEPYWVFVHNRESWKTARNLFRKLKGN